MKRIILMPPDNGRISQGKRAKKLRNRGYIFSWRVRSAILMLTTLLLIVPLPAGAATYAVRQDGGGDYTSVQDAIDAIPETLSEPYIVEIQDDGIYPETVSINGKITDSSNTITLRALEGVSPSIYGQNTYAGAINLGSNYITVEGLTVRAKGDRAHGILVQAHYSIIRNCIVYNAVTANPGSDPVAGIFLDSAGNNRVSENLVYGNINGIRIYDFSSDENRIENNVIHGNTYHGIWIYRSTENNLIINNTLYQNEREIYVGHGGQWYDCGAGNVFKNNIIFAGSGGFGIAVDTYDDPGTLPSGTVFDYNDIHAPGGTFAYIDNDTYGSLASWRTGTGQDANSISSDPLFLDAGGNDFHLDDYSPCIGAGIAEGAPLDDFEGIPRGAPPDMGAYENPGDAPLPVELSSFTATVLEGGVHLRWRTESEVENLGFDVFRGKERDGPFFKINDFLIPGAGSSPVPHEYEFADADVVEGCRYFYYLEDVDTRGQTNRSEMIDILVPITSMEGSGPGNRPGPFALLQNYPNPCNPRTCIPYFVASPCHVEIRIYSTTGHPIRTLFSGRSESGEHRMLWNGRNDAGEKVASGVYYYVLRAGEFDSTRKLVVMK